MKTKIALVFLAIGLLISCRKVSVRSIEKDMVKGTWKISKFYENGFTRTDSYSSNVFTFNKNGTLSVLSNGFIVHGTWSVGKTDGKVIFSLNMAVPLDELSNDWEVADHTSSTLELRHAGVEGTVDLLTFVKN